MCTCLVSWHEKRYFNDFVVDKVSSDEYHEAQELDNDCCGINKLPFVVRSVYSSANGNDDSNNPHNDSSGDIANRSGKSIDILGHSDSSHVKGSNRENTQNAEK